MKVFHGLTALPCFTRPVVTVGVYDGVHRGHQALIAQLVAEARAQQGESILLTFDPHPRITLGRVEGLHLLTTLDEKIAIFERLGIDHIIIIPFDKAFSALSGAEFIQRYIRGAVGAQTLVVGYDHRFGHDHIGYDELMAIPNLRVVRVDECHVGDAHVSSTAIRRLLERGELAEAEHLLGHPLSLGSAAIANSQQHATQIYFPYTVNPVRTQPLITQLVALWRESVMASHHFLTASDIEKLVPTVTMAITQIETIVIAGDEQHPVAFMGLDDDKVEMLFVTPGSFGQGIGRMLMTLAIERFGARRVDVNEQNPAALGFYRRMGFEVYGRTETDEQGNPFPILELQLKNS